MALYHPPIKCNYCGHQNSFNYNPLTEAQKIQMFVGDNGGDYPSKCENCGKSLLDLPEIDLTTVHIIR